MQEASGYGNQLIGTAIAETDMVRVFNAGDFLRVDGLPFQGFKNHLDYSGQIMVLCIPDGLIRKAGKSLEMK